VSSSVKDHAAVFLVPVVVVAAFRLRSLAFAQVNAANFHGTRENRRQVVTLTAVQLGETLFLHVHVFEMRATDRSKRPRERSAQVSNR
jgi:hypothetical protein